MAPDDNIHTRKHGDRDMVEIDGRPYYPMLAVNPSSLESVKQVAATLLLPGTLATAKIIDALQVRRISGGNTNQLFCVSGWNQLPFPKDDSILPGSVLVRVFGAHGILDRDVENATYAALGQRGLAPTYFGRFANGRIEQFLEGMRPLETRELADPEISGKIARAMARLHVEFTIPEGLEVHHSEPRLWNQLGEWMTKALAIKCYKTPEDVERAKELVDLNPLPAELEWLQNQVVPKDIPTCFCHNDVLASNVMYSEETKEIQLIDFEYGGINFAAMDVANHFNEFAGGEEDACPKYDFVPSPDFQRRFIKAYLEAQKGYHSVANDVVHPEVTEKEILDFQTQVEAFVLVDHLYCGLWGVNQAAMEGTEGFDYLLYGSHRIREYYRQRLILDSKLKSGSTD